MEHWSKIRKIKYSSHLSKVSYSCVNFSCKIAHKSKKKTFFSMSFTMESKISQYSDLCYKNHYIGKVLIHSSSLQVDLQLHWPFVAAHAPRLKQMYNGDTDTRSNAPLECVVLLQNGDKVAQWVAEKDSHKLSNTQTEDMLMLSIPGYSFLIVEGQHCYRAYVEVFQEQALPRIVPHPGYLCVDLYYSVMFYMLHITLLIS